MLPDRNGESSLTFVRERVLVKRKDIGAVLIGDEATIKYFYPVRNKVILKSANPEFKPIIFKNDKRNEKEFRTLGKVVAVLRTV